MTFCGYRFSPPHRLIHGSERLPARDFCGSYFFPRECGRIEDNVRGIVELPAACCVKASFHCPDPPGDPASNPHGHHHRRGSSSSKYTVSRYRQEGPNPGGAPPKRPRSLTTWVGGKSVGPPWPAIKSRAHFLWVNLAVLVLVQGHKSAWVMVLDFLEHSVLHLYSHQWLPQRDEEGVGPNPGLQIHHLRGPPPGRWPPRKASFMSCGIM